MTIALNHRARGIQGVRADAANVSAVLAELNKTFAEFKAANDEELKGIKNRFADVVQTEKVDRINAEVDKLSKLIDTMSADLAAQRAGAGGGAEATPENRAYSEAFNRYFRKGVENGLHDLAVKAALRTDSDPDGGYVVPVEMESAIDRILGTVSSMRSIATVMSIGTGTYKKLVNQGGAASGWVGEAESRPQTATPTLSDLEFNVMEMYANPAATRAALDDARIDLAAWLAGEVEITFSEQEGAAFINGSGVKRPRGLLQYDKVANASYAWGKIGYAASGVAAALTDANNKGVDALISVLYALKAGYRSNARWLMNRNTIATIRKLKDGNDQYLWQPPVTAGEPATILGYPTTDDDNMPDIGAGAFPAAFGDFRRGYLILDRQGIRVLRDEYTNKPYVHFYTTKRVGGGVQNFEAIKLLKIATS